MREGEIMGKGKSDMGQGERENVRESENKFLWDEMELKNRIGKDNEKGVVWWEKGTETEWCVRIMWKL